MTMRADLSPIKHFALVAALTLAGAASMIACGHGHDEDFPEVDCDAVEVKSYSEMTVWDSCASCHGSTLEGADRQNAPEGVDFDSYEAAVTDADHAALSVADGTMPPEGGLSSAEKDDLYAWVRCGMPE